MSTARRVTAPDASGPAHGKFIAGVRRAGRRIFSISVGEIVRQILWLRQCDQGRCGGRAISRFRALRQPLRAGRRRSGREGWTFADRRRRVSGGFVRPARRAAAFVTHFLCAVEVLIFFRRLGAIYTSLLESRISSAGIAILLFTEPGGAQLEGLRQQLLARAQQWRGDADLVSISTSCFLRMTSPAAGQNHRSAWAESSIQIGGALDCLFAAATGCVHAVARTRILHAGRTDHRR